MNANTVKLITEKLGLIERPKGVISGIYKDYYMTLKEQQKNIYVLVVQGNNKAECSQEDIDKFIDSIKGIQGVSNCVYDKRCLKVLIAVMKNDFSYLFNCVDMIVGFFGDNGFKTGCAHCDDVQKNVSLCGVYGTYEYVCDDCFNIIEEESKNKQPEKSPKKGNLPAGIVGAFLGTLIGAVLWIIIYNLGFIAGIAGLVMTVCAFKGYELIGGRLSKTGVIISVIIVIVMIFFTNTLCYGIEVHSVFSEQYGGVSFFESYRIAMELVFENVEGLLGYFIKDLVVGYLLTIVASFSAIKNAFTDNGDTPSVSKY